MTAFLKQIAGHFIESGFFDTCFIFPNRRSMAFFRKYAAECVAGSDKPVIAPDMMTINDFIFSIAGGRQADRITQLLILYDCYKELNPKAESLDEFIFWGDVLLGDFDDVDKYLVNPHDLFANVADLKAIQDDLSHLDEKQRAAIERFISHFSAERMKITSSVAGKTDVKGNFMQIWNILYPLYVSFNKALRDKGLSYTGMAYRRAKEICTERPVKDVMKELFPHSSHFVFVGLNSLSKSEMAVLLKMKDAGIAEFCWDHCGTLVNNPGNKSSRFINENIRLLGRGLELDSNENHVPEINVVSVPSAVGQVKILPHILEKCGFKEGVNPDDFAVVLPDESLLMPLLETIPPAVRDINVTMGFPMKESEFYALVSEVCRLQMHLGKRGEEYRFYHKYVWNIFASGIFKRLSGEQEQKTVNEIKTAARYYVPQKDFGQSDLMKMIFRPAVKDASAADSKAISEICDYLLELVSYLGSRMASDEELALQTDFARMYWQNVTILKEKSLAVKPATFFSLLESLVSSESVPFNGEPLKGLQIMGPLETRSLDFKNVVIMSANDGVFPGKSVSNSFIPAELRKGFDLPSYDQQDSMWAYYFYRLISRADKVWLVYDSRSEGLQSGEESRFIKQLRYDFELPMNNYVSKASLKAGERCGYIEKTVQHVEKIRDIWFSASTLENYISCPARFYYSKIEGLQKETEVTESLDAGMLGNVYHNTMFCLYFGGDLMMRDEPFDKLKKDGTKGMDRVSQSYLKEWLGREKDIRAKVYSLIRHELNSDEVVGRDLVAAEVVVKYVMNTISRDLELLTLSANESFAVEGLEMKNNVSLYGFKFFGVIDRLDRLSDGSLRVVDYKTGGDNPGVLSVKPGKEDEVADKLFYGSYDDRRTNKAALQFHIYDRMLQANGYGENILNSMYATPKLAVEAPVAYELNSIFAEALDERLEALFAEMVNADIPFKRSEDSKACEYCDFKTICGR